MHKDNEFCAAPKMHPFSSEMDHTHRCTFIEANLRRYALAPR